MLRGGGRKRYVGREAGVLFSPPVTLCAVAGGGPKRCPSGAGARARKSQEGHV